MSDTVRIVDPLDISVSCSVTASAGTGKTYNLTKRYVALLKNGTSPEHILCLTFTDKAAAEMRMKIGEDVRLQLAEAKREKRSNEEAVLTRALDTLHRCCISTFHGFCSSLLREFPLEAGVPVGYSIMDEFDEKEIVRSTIKEILQSPPDVLCDDVVRLFISFDEGSIVKTIEELLANWKECRFWFDKLKTDEEYVLDAWRRSYKYCIDEALKEFGLNLEIIDNFRRGVEVYEAELSAKNNKSSSKIKGLYVEVQRLQKAGSLEEICAILTSMVDSDKYGSVKVNSLPDGMRDAWQAFKAAKDKVKDIVNNICPLSDIPPEELELAKVVLNAFGNLAEFCHERVEQLKEDAGCLNFDDLIEKSVHLLNEKENPAVVDELRKRFEYVLVDEVQDNNPVLTDIVRILAGNPKENNKLFIVGDLKQSIYGFNKADPIRVSELIDLFDAQASLLTCRRTYEPVLSLINRVFSAIYPKTEKADGYLDLTYPDISAYRMAECSTDFVGSSQTKGTVTILKNRESGSVSEKAAAEAECIASWIYNAVVASEQKIEVYDKKTNTWRWAEFKDVAILVRSRTHNAELKAALSGYGIAYQEYKGRNFYELQEIYDIVSVLKAILTPEDDVSLYGALRSPYFGVSDVELARVSFNAKGLTLYDKLSGADSSQISEALALLSRLKDLSRTMPLSLFLHEVVIRTGILTVYSAVENGVDMIANLNKFLQYAEMKSAECSISLFELVRLVDISIDEEVLEEEASSDDDAENRVKILTVHASKGLEFPIVILAFTGDGSIISDKGFMVDERFGLVYSSLKPYGKENEDGARILSSVSKAINRRKKEEAVEERKRLFYVAMTRARDHLVLSVTEGKKGLEENSFMSMYRMGVLEEEDMVSDYVSDNPFRPERDTKRVVMPEGWDVHEGVFPRVLVCGDADSDFSAEVAGSCGLHHLNDAVRRGSCIHEILAGADVDLTCRKYGLDDAGSMMRNIYNEFFSCGFFDLNEGDSWCELSLYDRVMGVRRVDRLVMLADGSYCVVDYKTGMRWLSDDGLESYKEQVDGYVALLSSILGVDSIQAYLYLVDVKEPSKRWVKIVGL